MRSASAYKFISGALALVLALGGAYAAKKIHDTQLEVNTFREEQVAAQGQLDTLRGKLQSVQDVLQKLETDPDFADRLARARLDYARPDEYVFRFDVDPVTGTPATTDTDNGSSALNAPLLPFGQTPAPANPGVQRR